MTDEHPNRAERAEQALAELAGHDGSAAEASAQAYVDRLFSEMGMLDKDGDRLIVDFCAADVEEAFAAGFQAGARQLATERANADRLAEEVEYLVALCEPDYPESAQDALQALAAHNLLRIDG